MKIQGKAADQIEKLVEQFRTGDVSKSVAKVLIKSPNIPSSNWSTLNRWISFVQTGDIDCRGFRQWEKAERKVTAGEKAAYILRPITIKKEDIKENGEKEEKFILIGFGSIPVFGYSQTSGKPVKYDNIPNELPNLMNVAKEFNIEVKYGVASDCYGAYNPSKNSILLCTPEEQTFYHELSHAAHHRIIGNLKNGQHPSQEIVAEFCACVLARLFGKKSALEGNTYEYIEAYAKQIKKTVHESVLSFMTDIVKVLDLIITTHEKISETKIAA
jgi:hypothetical protein